MEKVKIAGCQEKGKTKQNKPWYAVNLEDGRAPTGFEDLSKFIGQEIELDVFKNDKGYWAFRMPKKEGAPPNLRVEALKAAASADISGEADHVITMADKLLIWLKQE
jgi:hypothetical protein